MPNWCDNSVTLRNDDKSKVDALESEMSKKNEEGHSMACPFQHLRPNPTGEWQYDWSCENWGTKWDANIIDWERRDDNEIWISFDSAWSPPTALYDYLVEQGWDVDAVYHEPGMCFAGLYTTDGGDDYYEYDITDESTIEDLPSDIVEFAGLEDAHREWMINELEDQWGDAERTDWYPADAIAPTREGWYEITTAGWEFPQFCRWDGENWDSWNTVTQWRGLAEEPNEEEVD